MRKYRSALLVVLLTLSLANAGASQSAAGQSKEREVTVEGEIVDIYCYLNRHQGSGMGKEHAACTDNCIRKGGVVGFVTDDGDLYLLLNSNSTPLKTRVARLGGRKGKGASPKPCPPE